MPFVVSAPIARTPVASVGSSMSINPLSKRTSAATIAQLGPRLRELVSIRTDSSSDDNYARIDLNGPGCPFLSEGWCAIQKKLGEAYLPIMCSAYPRVMNVVDDVLQRSLDLSCPEAARLVLLDPNPMQFDEEEGPPARPAAGPPLDPAHRRTGHPTNPTGIFARFAASSSGCCNTARFRCGNGW